MGATLEYKFFRDIGLVDDAMKVSLTTNDSQAINTTPFNELLVAEKSTIIELKPTYGISTIRDIVTTSGTTATVSNDIGDREYDLEISGASTYASLESVERGRYVTGKGAEYGIGVRLSHNSLTGDTVARWGAIANGDGNPENGFYFGADSGGTFVAVIDEGSEEKIYQQDWNVDTLDGNGPSGEDLDLTDGQVYSIEFTWYGYGVISFVVFIKDATGKGLRRIIAHRYTTNGKTSVKSPDLPITADLKQTNETAQYNMFIAGRQFSVLGNYTPAFRATSEYVVGATVPTSGLIPLISFQEKVPYHIITGKVDGVDVLSTEPILVEIYTNTTLTGATFDTPTRKLSGETAFNSDTSATNVDLSNADLLYRTIIAGGSGNSKALGNEELRGLELTIPEDLIVTVVAQSLGASDSDVDLVFRIREEW